MTWKAWRRPRTRDLILLALSQGAASGPELALITGRSPGAVLSATWWLESKGFIERHLVERPDNTIRVLYTRKAEVE